MKLYNTTTLAGALVLAMTCASACNRADREVSSTTTTTTESTGTVSNTTLAPSETTIAQNDTSEMPKTMDNTGSVPPVAADEGSGSGSKDVTHKTTTKKTMKKKHVKKTHETSETRAIPAAPVVINDDDMYDPSEGVVAQDDSLDASQDFDETVSGTTMAPMTYRETGLSPFAQEPFSRTPAQIGSGQMTGEDKSTTVLDAPGLFQDPAALNRNLIQ